MRSLISVMVLTVGSLITGNAEAEQAAPNSTSQPIAPHAVVVDEPIPSAVVAGSGEVWDLIKSTGQPMQADPAGPRQQPDSAVLMKATANAKIRVEPSFAGEIIGMAPASVSVAPIAHVADWVLILDPWSWEMGWIHSKLLAPHSIDMVSHDRNIRLSAATPEE